MRVTINLVRNDLAFIKQKPAEKLHIVDRILRFFSTPAYGVVGWDSSHTDSITLKITGEGINESMTIPAGATSYSTTVPSGIALVFSLTHTSIIGSQTNWGGIYKTVLQSGIDAQITITMLPIVLITSASHPDVSFYSLPYGYESIVTGCRLYRSVSPDGPYILVVNQTYANMADSISDSSRNVADTTDLPDGSLVNWRVYYKIAVYGPSGEGVPTEAYTYNFGK